MTKSAGPLALLCAVLAALLSVAFPADGWAETRLALVIGNADYQSAPLRNPVNDAGLMAETLEGLGFHVTLLTNLDQKGLKRAISEFGRSLDTAGRDAVGLFYYSGHGLQVKGNNYLIPVGAVIEHPMDIDIEGLRAQTVLDVLSLAGNRLNFVILDACRDNPLPATTKSAAQGLASMSATSGTLIAYATGPGQVAADGSGLFSPYTEALSAVLENAEVPAESVFREVRTRVIEKTNGTQVPWETSSLVGRPFFFGPPATEDHEAIALAQFPVSAGVSAGKGLEVSADAVVWNGIRESDRAVDFETFLGSFPESPFAPFASARLAALRPGPVPSVPQTASDPVEQMDATYIAREAANLRAAPSAASRKLGSVAEGTPLSVTGKVEKANWYRISAGRGSQAFVFGDLVVPVNREEMALWERVKDSNRPELFEAYLTAFPHGVFSAAAKRLSLALDTSAPADPAGPQTAAVPGFPTGKIFRDCDICPEMVVVPPGAIADPRSGTAGAGEAGTVVPSLAVGRFEVTRAEWEACVAAGGCVALPGEAAVSDDQQRPAVNVTWQGAQAYLAWLGRTTGKAYRLLSEAEWEHAARGGTPTPFHFGNVLTPELANITGAPSDRSDRDGVAGRPLAVGSFSPNDYGLFDVHGNAWELTSGCVRASTATAAVCDQPVLRGGGWDAWPEMATSSFRGALDAASPAAVGLRVARPLP